MSKIFNRIQKAEQRTGSKTGFPRLEIDGWLREIHESVEEQVTGVELDAERPMPSVAVEVFSKIERPPIEETPISDLEFRFGSLRHVHVSSVSERILSEQNGHSHQLAAEAFRSVRTRLLKQQVNQKAFSFLISSSAASDGKSLTSINLAVCLAQLHNQKVLLVDGDLRTGGITRQLSLPVAPGLGELLSGKAAYEAAIAATDIKNLYVISKGNGAGNPPELYTRSEWQQLISWARKYFTTILIDAPPVLPLADFELMAHACDGVVLVVKARRTERDTLKKAIGQIEPKKLIGTVFNGVEDRDVKLYGYSGKK